MVNFSLFANGTYTGIISGVVVIFMGIEKNSMDGPACCSAIVASFLLSFRNLINVKKYLMIYLARYFLKKKKH